MKNGKDEKKKEEDKTQRGTKFRKSARETGR
jgi:hypothetical protein